MCSRWPFRGISRAASACWPMSGSLPIDRFITPICGAHRDFARTDLVTTDRSGADPRSTCVRKILTTIHSRLTASLPTAPQSR